MRYVFPFLIGISFLIFFPEWLMAQKFRDYHKEWAQVTSFTEKGLINSARNEVKVILQKAISENNSPQQVKAVLYLMKFTLIKEESPVKAAIGFIDSLQGRSTEPVKSMLLSLKADLLAGNLLRNQYRIKTITQLANESGDNIDLWSEEKYKKEIAENYARSLHNEKDLKSFSLASFESILNKGENTNGLWPTLFDLLANRAINGLSSILKIGVQPLGALEINQKEYFGPAEQFIAIPVTATHKPDILAEIISIYQTLLKFHQRDANPAAFIDADLQRLKFVREKTTLPSPDSFFETALLTLENKFNNTPELAEVMAERASLYYNQGQQYDYPSKLNYKNEIRRCYDLCQTIIHKYPKSYGAQLAGNLLSNILQPSLQVSTEMVIVPGEPFKTLVTFNNVKNIYFRLYKVSSQEIKDFNNRYYDTDKLKAFLNKKIYKDSNLVLPKVDDYREHKTEIAFEAIPSGNYILIVSNESAFSLNTSLIIAKPLYISNLAILYDQEKNVTVVNRSNGQPVPYARVQLWIKQYNNKTYGYDWKRKGEVEITDTNGHTEIKNWDDETYYGNFIEVTTNNDQLATQEQFYLYRNPGFSEKEKEGFIFTDRAIYRPGQKVFVKGILYNIHSRLNKSIAANTESKLSLLDANGINVKEIPVKTNEFGSYAADFDLPATGLTGVFTLTDSYSLATNSIRVEEYKRPKFKVTLDKPMGNFRVGDTVIIKGSAMAYAGNSISAARVTYHVTREPRFPEWWYYYRYFQPPASKAEIASGELATDESGGFQIRFNAIPDESIDRASQPRFNYQLSVDVTDINGETRSSSLTITAAYQSMLLDIVSPEKLSSDSLNSILIFSKNLSGNTVPATITTQLLYLKDPHKIYKMRYWEIPDVFSMTKTEHDRLFPFDPYQNEDQISSWAVERKMLDRTDTTSESGKYTLGFSQLPSGWYKIIAFTKDISGDTIRAEKILMITDGNGNFGGTQPAITLISNKKVMEPGETGTIRIQSGFEKIYVIATQSIIDRKAIDYYNIKLDDPLKIQVLVDSSCLGGIGYAAVTVMRNRYYNSNTLIHVPFSGKELDIRYESFRDKLEPGTKETWTVHINERKNKNRITEVLASMYDASLDQIVGHNWAQLSSLWPDNPFAHSFTGLSFKAGTGSLIANPPQKGYTGTNKIYPNYAEKLAMGLGGGRYYMQRNSFANAEAVMEGAPGSPKMLDDRGAQNKSEEVSFSFNTKKNREVEPDETLSQGKSEGEQVPLRSNFNETAFFFPQLKTDSNGNSSFSFSIPEALTQWKLMTMAHTPDLASGYDERFVVTQKKLMVQPNLPRFIMEGDRIEIPVKIVNLSDKEFSGSSNLELFDLASGKPVDGWFQNQFPNQYFKIAPGQSVILYFPVAVPVNFNSALKWQIKAITNDKLYSDGETDALPVLTNRVLVTETLPMYSSAPGKKNYSFNKLINQGENQRISNYRYTIEYSSNPAWYAVQALPYLMEFPYECVEQTFNRYYANSIAAGIINKYPKIKSIFEQWKTKDSSALLSNLEKNQELKSALLEETPWVMQAKSESERKQRIAGLFNLEKLGAEQFRALNKVIDAQQSNGGFSWFKGGEPNRYMSQYILTGLGHLIKLKVLDDANTALINDLITSGIRYADNEIVKEYQELIRTKQNLKDDHLSYLAIQYLYLRSFYPEIELSTHTKQVINYFEGQLKKYWLRQSKYMQAMGALALERTGEHKTASGILKSLKENALFSDEMGMYWAEFNRGGYYWYQAPIESQAMMIETFTEIDKDSKTINLLKTWLLRQKQTQDWGTTKATAEACYALLIGGDDWLGNSETVSISLGGKPADMPPPEAGTGYQKKIYDEKEISPSLGRITVEVPEQGKHGNAVTWGAAYWQYFEDQDKISAAASGITVKKKILIEKNSDKGPVLVELKQGEEYHVGDKVKIRLEVTADRNLEYVHLKDTRPATLEPGNILSGYQWQNGLGYYQSTRDASTNYFFHWLPKGTYVFEYPAFISQRGDFSSGLATLQCMYAPEFSGHSSGQRLEVGN